MSPERVAERVEDLIESILRGPCHAYVEENGDEALHYIRQVYERGVINQTQLDALVASVEQAAKD